VGASFLEHPLLTVHRVAPSADRSYWNPGTYETISSMSAPSNALPRLRTLLTNSKNLR
jgi:hypothetical protein